MKLATLIALACSWNAETGRFDAGCGPHIEAHYAVNEQLAKAACETRAVELRTTSPAGTKIVEHACRTRPEPPTIARKP